MLDTVLKGLLFIVVIWSTFYTLGFLTFLGIHFAEKFFMWLERKA